jgi:anthranilate 1,2-dioxygenase small subunit
MSDRLALEATRRLVEDLIHAVARAIDDDRLEEFPDFFVADGIYKVQSRFNVERGLPLAQINCTSRGMITDRISSLRRANVYEHHRYRHLISGIHIVQHDERAATVRSSYMVVRIMDDGSSSIFATGEYRDRIFFADGAALLAERIVLFDSKSIETLLAIPL